MLCQICVDDAKIIFEKAQSLKKILFVCVHNSGRSQIAEAFFNYLAGGRAIAYSAGTRPDKHLNPRVVEILQEVGVDTIGQAPKALTLEMLEQVDMVISMGCGVEGVCPASFVETEDWNMDDPKGKSIEKVREIRDEIKTRVIKLLDNI